jgi:hypothetical protein
MGGLPLAESPIGGGREKGAAPHWWAPPGAVTGPRLLRLAPVRWAKRVLRTRDWPRGLGSGAPWRLSPARSCVGARRPCRPVPGLVKLVPVGGLGSPPPSLRLPAAPEGKSLRPSGAVCVPRREGGRKAGQKPAWHAPPFPDSATGARGSSHRDGDTGRRGPNVSAATRHSPLHRSVFRPSKNQHDSMSRVSAEHFRLMASRSRSVRREGPASAAVQISFTSKSLPPPFLGMNGCIPPLRGTSPHDFFLHGKGKKSFWAFLKEVDWRSFGRFVSLSSADLIWVFRTAPFHPCYPSLLLFIHIPSLPFSRQFLSLRL